MNKTAYEMRIIDWSSDVCSSELDRQHLQCRFRNHAAAGRVAIWRGRKLLGADPRRQAPGRDHSRQPCHGLRYSPFVAYDFRKAGRLWNLAFKWNFRVDSDNGPDADRKSTRLNSSH